MILSEFLWQINSTTGSSLRTYFFISISTSFYNARNKKIAYDFIKRSQEPVALMIREPKDGFLSLVAVNEFLTDKTVKYKVTDLSNHTVLFNGEAVAKANDAVKLNSIPFLEGEIHFYLMEWQYDGISKKIIISAVKLLITSISMLLGLRKRDFFQTKIKRLRGISSMNILGFYICRTKCAVITAL